MSTCTCKIRPSETNHIHRRTINCTTVRSSIANDPLNSKKNYISTDKMFGIGRPQPSSAEKIAAVEAEMKLITAMAARYV